MTITSERWENFLTRVIDVRHLQSSYRKSLDPATRRLMEDAEALLDATAAHLAEDLGEPDVDVLAAIAAGERGAP